MLGLGLGLHKNTFVGGGIDPNQLIINTFKARVLADGGTFEAEQCLKDSLPALIENEPSLAVTPNAKEAGKLFSIIPTNGARDLDVVRATTATYVDADGVIQTAGINEPRFDYSNGSCPSILVEPQRTNLLRNGNLAGAVAPITFPTNWSISPTVGTVAGTGIENGLNYVDFNFNFIASGSNIQIATDNTTAITATLGQTFTASTYFKILDATLPPNSYEFRFRGGTSTGSFTENIHVTFTPNNLFDRYSSSYTITNASTQRLQVLLYFGTILGQSYNFTIRVYAFQVEQGSNATSYIPTTTTSVTRNADVISKSGISDLIGQTDGTIYCEFISNDDTNWNSSIFSVNNSNANERIQLRYNSTPAQPSGGYLNLNIRTGNTIVVNLNADTLIPIEGQRYKVCVTYSQTAQKIFVNGVLVATRTGSYTQPNTMDYTQLGGIAGNNFISNTSINSALIIKNVISDAEAIQLTTL